MIEQLKLLAMTVILTLLIWTGADRLVNDTVTVGLAIEPVGESADDAMLVRLDPPGKYFEVQLAGPRRNIEVAGAAAPLKIRYPIATRPTGRSTLRLERATVKSLLDDLSRDFRRVSVLSVVPSELPLVVDRVVERDVELTVGRLALSYDAKPRLQPSRVSVRLRESRALELAASGQWQVLDVSAEVERLLKEQPVGESVTVLMSLDTRSFGADAEVVPKVVEVTASLQSARTIAEVPAVPIRLALSFAHLQRGCKAVTPDGTPLTLVTSTISVAGPTDEVGRLLRGDTKAFGIIQLKESDFDELGVVRSFTPEFQLPRALELTSKPEPIEFKLVPSETAGRTGE